MSALERAFYTALCVSLAVVTGMPADAEVSEYVRSRAAAAGYTVQTLDSTADSAILGQWYLEGVLAKDCIDGFFYEFRPDGYAVDQTGHKYRYEVESDKIVIRGTGTAVFQMSGGGFFVPSHECLLGRLVRGAPLQIKVPGEDPRKVPKAPSDPYSVRRLY